MVTRMKKLTRLSKMIVFSRPEHFIGDVLPAESSLCFAQVAYAPNPLLSLSPPLPIYLSFSYSVFAIHRSEVTSISLGTACTQATGKKQTIHNQQTQTELRVASSCLGRDGSGFSRKRAVGQRLLGCEATSSVVSERQPPLRNPHLFLSRLDSEDMRIRGNP